MPRLPDGARAAFVAAAAALLLAGAPRAQAQCSMCKTVVTGSEEGRSLGRELNKAIVIMVAAPYLVFGGVVAALFRRRLAPVLPPALMRRARARTERSVEDRGELHGDRRGS
jgi:hypothetical protein